MLRVMQCCHHLYVHCDAIRSHGLSQQLAIALSCMVQGDSSVALPAAYFMFSKQYI